MRAVAFSLFGNPDVLQLVDLPEPSPKPGEVKVRVYAAGVNPTDILRRTGYFAAEMPCDGTLYVPGMDFAGILQAVGPATRTDLRVGEKVMGVVVPRRSNGAYADYVLAPAASVVRIPANAGLLAASTILMSGLTALAVLGALELSRGDTLAVTGAAGVVGGYVIQLANALGLRVIGDASAADAEYVRRTGADVVVERGNDVAHRILAAAPEGVKGVADCATLNDALLPCVRDGGRVATLLLFTGAGERGITFHPVRVREHLHDRERLEKLRRLVEDGTLRPRVAATYPAGRAAEAHERQEGGGVRGRLVLTFD